MTKTLTSGEQSGRFDACERRQHRGKSVVGARETREPRVGGGALNRTNAFVACVGGPRDSQVDSSWNWVPPRKPPFDALSRTAAGLQQNVGVFSAAAAAAAARARRGKY